MTERKPAESRRREITDAALKVIAEQGLARFTSLAIAREVGVSDAALFRHFATKNDIVLAVIDRVEEILFSGFPPVGADPIERLGQFFRRRIEVILQNPGVARLVGSDQLSQAAPPEGVARVAEFRHRSQSFVQRTLVEAHREGLISEGVGPEEATVLVLGALMALAHALPPLRPSAQLPERVWGALEHALRRVKRRPAGVRGAMQSSTVP